MPRTLVPLVALLFAAPASPADDFFEKSVRPVLVARCVSCHGPDKQKGGLRLDSRAAASEVVVPGRPDQSKLVQAVRRVGDVKMPPDKPLAAHEVAALEKWVSLGAPWPDGATLAAPSAIEAAAAKHWAFRVVKRPTVPVLSTQYSLLSHPIDRFVVAKLHEKGLALSPEADRRTLIRRAYFDLHGLPPTADEADAFAADVDPRAYEKLIDKLLASPRYGERWGRHWLDVARYADNKGYVFFEDKNYPWAWTYRDYVIDALNRDVPFDRFVTEQLAADLLPNRDPKALAALGFLTVGGHFMNNTHDIIDDRIDVVTRGLMGLTVSCARCHDHKYDPVPTADYYSLYGVFRSCTEPTVPPLLNDPPATLTYRMYATLLAAREKKLLDFVTAKHTELVTQARTRAGEYLLAADAARRAPPADDFMLLADKGDLNPTMVTRWRVYLEDTRKSGDPVWVHWHALADLPEKDFATKAPTVIAGLKAGHRTVRMFIPRKPQSLKDVAAFYGKLLAVADAPDPHPDADVEQLRQVLHGPRSPAEAPLALDWGFLSLFPDRATQGEFQKLIKDVEAHAAKGPPRPMVLRDADRVFDPQVFLRGHPNRLGEHVPRQAPKVVSPARKPFAQGSGRLELAREIVSKDNPLTARVFVNRVWTHHFGKGLVSTPSDFGLRSDPPTHPELLDWLAAEFVARGWSVKQLHKLVVTSAAYRQASRDRADGLVADPENRLLWKANRRRLEFEALHDATLAAAGTLDLTVGGPPVPLFAGKTRRAVYGYVDRLEFPSLLSTFDVPNPATSSPHRTPTTVAPQALYLMNGPFARDAAKKLAARKPTVDGVFRAVLGRSPSADERKLANEFVAKGADPWADLAHGLMMTNEFAFVD